MNKHAYRIQHITKLLRLQSARIAAAETEYRLSQVEYNKVEAAMQTRQARIERMQQQLDSLMNYGAEDDVSERIRFSDGARVRKKWLNHDLERDEYWLKDDQRELNEAATQIDKMRGLWLQARVRETGMQNLLNEARSSQTRETEQRLETEATEFVTSGLRSLR